MASEVNTLKKENHTLFKIVVYVVCIILTILSLFPFIIMIVNSTRDTHAIQQHALSLIPGSNFMKNYKILTGKSFNPWKGLLNSFIVSTGATACTKAV